MLLGFVLVCLAAVSWGTTGSVMALLAREGTPSPLLVGWARMAGAAPCLLLAIALVPPGTTARGEWQPRDWAKAALLGAAMAAYQVCYFWAVPRTGVALTALLAICSAPLMIAAGAALTLKERPSPATLAALLLSIAGTAMVLAGPRADGAAASGFTAGGFTAGTFAAGAFAALGAGLSYAVYAVIAKGLLARIAPLPLAALTFTLAALLLTPVLVLERGAPAQLAAGWPLLLYLGVVPTAAAYVVFGAGLRRVTVTTAGIATLLEPLTAAALGVLLFGERLGAVGWAGAALLLGALGLLAWAGSDSPSSDRPS
ncbi:MAG TPA: EamA family transporter [Methylomirabilota bacterium]|nr:EamA family transporter [Methylomirabilota bacterium]